MESNFSQMQRKYTSSSFANPSIGKLPDTLKNLADGLPPLKREERELYEQVK